MGRAKGQSAATNTLDAFNGALRRGDAHPPATKPSADPPKKTASHTEQDAFSAAGFDDAGARGEQARLDRAISTLDGITIAEFMTSQDSDLANEAVDGAKTVLRQLMTRSKRMVDGVPQPEDLTELTAILNASDPHQADEHLEAMLQFALDEAMPQLREHDSDSERELAMSVLAHADQFPDHAASVLQKANWMRLGNWLNDTPPTAGAVAACLQHGNERLLVRSDGQPLDGTLAAWRDRLAANPNATSATRALIMDVLNTQQIHDMPLDDKLASSLLQNPLTPGLVQQSIENDDLPDVYTFTTALAHNDYAFMTDMNDPRSQFLLAAAGDLATVLAEEPTQRQGPLSDATDSLVAMGAQADAFPQTVALTHQLAAAEGWQYRDTVFRYFPKDYPVDARPPEPAGGYMLTDATTEPLAQAATETFARLMQERRDGSTPASVRNVHQETYKLMRPQLMAALTENAQRSGRAAVLSYLGDEQLEIFRGAYEERFFRDDINIADYLNQADWNELLEPELEMQLSPTESVQGAAPERDYSPVYASRYKRFVQVARRAKDRPRQKLPLAF